MVEAIIIGVIIAIAVLLLILCIVSLVKDRKEKNIGKATKEVIESKKEETKEEVVEEVKEETTEKKRAIKYVLNEGEGVVIGSEGNIPCGEYTIESADGSEDFKMRVGRYVKTFKNGDTVILTNNQKVTPLSASVVLR